MYQHTPHANPFLHSLCCASPSPSQSQTPPPPPPPAHRHSPSSDSGVLLGPPSSSLHSSASSAFSLHRQLVGGGSGSSSHLHDDPDGFDLPSYHPMSIVFDVDVQAPCILFDRTGQEQSPAASPKPLLPSPKGKNSILQPPGAEKYCCHREVLLAPAAVGRVARYNAEERKERIERYRSKRNQRNFQKKITYACRKTLADGRPRVRGRFARNGETEAEADAAGETGSCNNSSSHSRGEWCRRGPAGDEDDEHTSLDPDFWTGFLDSYLSMNSPIS